MGRLYVPPRDVLDAVARRSGAEVWLLFLHSQRYYLFRLLSCVAEVSATAGCGSFQRDSNIFAIGQLTLVQSSWRGVGVFCQALLVLDV